MINFKELFDKDDGSKPSPKAKKPKRKTKLALVEANREEIDRIRDEMKSIRRKVAKNSEETGRLKLLAEKVLDRVATSNGDINTKTETG